MIVAAGSEEEKTQKNKEVTSVIVNVFIFNKAASACIRAAQSCSVSHAETTETQSEQTESNYSCLLVSGERLSPQIQSASRPAAGIRIKHERKSTPTACSH